MSDVTFELTKPIVNGSEEIQSLTIKEPTIKVIRKIGLPFVMGGAAGSSFEIDADRVARYLVALCALPPSAIDQISAADFVGITKVISDFFGQSQETTSAS